MVEIFGKDNVRRAFFGVFAISAILCALATVLHFNRKYPGNPFTWITWLSCLVFFLATYIPDRRQLKEWALSPWRPDKRFVMTFALLALVFVVSHIWNFKTAPWNQNGLFDDAAWDIYFAKTHVLSGQPFQTAYSDGIAREAVFHYYITAFFLLFGYSLLTFNISLLLLGMITFLFTALLIHHFFHSYLVTIVSALVFNFLPLHFIQTFIGHRYSIAAPLMMASLYFLTTGFAARSVFRIALSAVLAGLCVQGAIMGKQFITCLAAAMILFVIFDYRRSMTREKTCYTTVFVVGLVASLIPLLVFIYYNQIVYFGHERDLTTQFLEAYKNRSAGALRPYVHDLVELFFAPFSGRRLAMQDYVIIPFAYYAFLVPGIVIALIKKRFEIVLLATVPVIGAFVSSVYDFRVLHAAPFWIILMAFSFDALNKLPRFPVLRRYAVPFAMLVIAGCIVAAGLIPSIRYLYAKSKNPYSIYLLGQSDVAVARFLRDIVAGAPHPSMRRRPNEFKKLPNLPEPAYDAFACNESGYAITHLFLQEYDDKRIMSFCEETRMANMTDTSVLAANKRVVGNYKGMKDLMLVWERCSYSAKAIAAFGKLRHFGSDKTIEARHAGRIYSFYVLTIPKENVAQFKREMNIVMFLSEAGLAP